VQVVPVVSLMRLHQCALEGGEHAVQGPQP